MKRKFEEEVVEETTTTDTVEEGTPDAHGQFVQILEDMGLSAEQAEAIHQMAMDLVNSTPKEGEESERVEASRMRRRAGRARMGRRQMSRSRRHGLSRMDRSNRPTMRRNFSDVERLERTVQRQRRQLSAMREQLENLGQRAGGARVNSAPNVNLNAVSPGVPQAGDAKSRVFEMMKNAL